MFIIQYHSKEYPHIFKNAKFDSREEAQWYLYDFKSGLYPSLKISATFTIKLKEKP